MSTWHSAIPPPEAATFDPDDWVRIVLRGVPLAIVVFGGLAVHMALRAVEWPLARRSRPVTPWITVGVCRAALRIMGLRRIECGAPMEGAGALVANHASWLDIFVLNATQPLYFVSKDEVAHWPGIGWLARATGTLFIARDRAAARGQAALLSKRLSAGHRLLFFPEGTSTDGWRVLPFKTTLFAPFLAPGLRETTSVQPISVIYRAPHGADPRFHGWWGGMAFGAHLLRCLAARDLGRVEIVHHAPVACVDAADRKDLARRTEAVLRASLERADKCPEALDRILRAPDLGPERDEIRDG